MGVGMMTAGLFIVMLQGDKECCSFKINRCDSC